MTQTAKTVMLYAWAEHENGDVGHVDASETTPEGWAVYLREDKLLSGGTITADAPEPFTITDERDFTSYEDALAYGMELAASHQCELEEY